MNGTKEGDKKYSKGEETENTSHLFQNNTSQKSFLQQTRLEEIANSYYDLTPKQQFDESFGVEDNFNHQRKNNTFRIKDHEELVRINKRKDSEMISISSRSNRKIDFDKSPNGQISKMFNQTEDHFKSLNYANPQVTQKQKKRDMDLNVEEEEEKLFKMPSGIPMLANKTTQDLTNQPSYNVVLDGASLLKQQSSSNQKVVDLLKNEDQSYQQSNTNLKVGASFRKNINCEGSLHEKQASINFDSYHIELNNKQSRMTSNILLPPPKLNESFTPSQDTFRPYDNSQQLNVHSSINRTKNDIQKSVGIVGKKGLGTLLNNSRKIKLFSKIRQKLRAFLQNHTVTGRTKVLDSSIRSNINDRVDYGYNRHKKKRQTDSILEDFHNLCIIILEFFVEKIIYITKLEKLPLFDPENPIKIIFNTIIVAYNCFFLYWMSIEVFFDAHVGDINEILGYTAQACWITEMLLQMNTCLYHDNEYITDRKEIMVIYFQEYLFFEILPLIFEAHIEACLFNVVGEIEMNILNKEINWISQNTIRDGSWWNSYLTSLFWAFSVMMNTSTAPTTDIEIIFTCICMLFSCVFFGYTLNLIGNILIDIQKQQKEYKRDLNILNQFMKRKNVSLSYRRKANISLQDFYAHNREKIRQEEEVILKLNPMLVKEVLISANRSILEKFTLFTEQFSQDVLEKIAVHLEEETYAPRQIILSPHYHGENQQYIYFIASGKVQIFQNMEKKEIHVMSHKREQQNKRKTLEEQYTKPRLATLKSVGELHHNERSFRELKDNFEIVTKREKKIINLLSNGDSFGQYGFFTGMNDDYLAQSQNFTTVMRLQRSKFLEILNEHPQEFERFCEIKDKILNEREDNFFYCYNCESNDHQTLQCNKVFFDKSNPNFFFQQNYSVPQQRQKEFILNELTSQKVQRLKHRHNHTILKINVVTDQANKVLEDEGLRSLLNQYYDNEDLENQNSASDSQLEDDEGHHSESISYSKSIDQFDLDNAENFSQYTHRSAKSGVQRKSIINSIKEELGAEDKVESLNYKQTPIIAPNINMIYASFQNNNSQNNNLLINDPTESPIMKKRHLSALFNEEKHNTLDSDQKGIDLQQNLPISRSIISNSNNIRKLSAAKKSTFLSEQMSFNTKEFEDHFSKAQEMLGNQQYQNEATKEMNEVFNQTCLKLKQVTEKYRSLFSHYITAKRQLKLLTKVDSPRNKVGINSSSANQKYQQQSQQPFKEATYIDIGDSQMLSSIDKQQQTPQITGAKSRFLEEIQLQNNNQQQHPSNKNLGHSNKESFNEIDAISRKYPIKETIVISAIGTLQNFIWTFDKNKNYIKYFPEFNIEKMTRKANIQIQKNQRKKVTKKKDNNSKYKQLASMKSDGKQNTSLQISRQIKQELVDGKKTKGEKQVISSSIYHQTKQKDQNKTIISEQS